MLIDELKEDLKQARLARLDHVSSPLRIIVGDIQTREKTGENATDEMVLGVVKKQIKSLEECANRVGQDDPRYDDYRSEIWILSKYMPKQLTEGDIIRIITEEFVNTGKTVNIGDCMKYLKQNYGEQVNGKIASKAIKENF